MAVSSAEAKAELAWRKFGSDAIWAAENAWRIEHPRGERQFDLREPQRVALRLWDEGSNSITLKARQIGWSTSVAFFAARLAMTTPDAQILFLSKGERESKLLLSKVKFGLDRLPDWMRYKAPGVVRSNMETIEFDNGATITSLPSRNNPARGFTGRLVVVDEWAFLDNGDEAWASIEPVTDLGGQVIGLSTANGSGNAFHEQWLRAQSGDSSFVPMFYSWRAVPERDDAWYESKKADMKLWQLHQEYPSSPEEAFIKSGAMVFDADVLDHIRDREICPWQRRGTLEYRLGEFRLIEDKIRGGLKIWEEPVRGGVYCIGADVAEGLSHGDWSTAHVLRIVKNDDASVDWSIVASYRAHIEPDLFGESLNALGRWYNWALIGVEANNHGLSTNTVLRNLKYPKQYREKKLDHRKRVKTERFGWWTDKKSKAVLVDDLRTALRSGLAMPDQGTLDELYTYVYDGRGGMNGSPHDDMIIALGISTQMAPLVFHKDYVVEEDDYMTPDWWMRQGDQGWDPWASSSSEDFFIGQQR
jgi:hypothetical protein